MISLILYVCISMYLYVYIESLKVILEHYFVKTYWEVYVKFQVFVNSILSLSLPQTNSYLFGMRLDEFQT
jgi:hypothetical protein